jgi:hypothetical protein
LQGTINAGMGLKDVRLNSLCRPVDGKGRGTWRRFSLRELHSATNNFNYDNKLGEGVIGSVYWGQLASGDQVRKLLYTASETFKIPFRCKDTSCVDSILQGIGREERMK